MKHTRWIALPLGLLILATLACGGGGEPTPTPMPPPTEPPPTQPPPPTGLDYTLEPNFGEVELESGFVPDPHEVMIVSGGDVDIDELDLGEGCTGYATSAPDFRIFLSGNSPAIRIFFVPDEEGEDATLVVNTATAGWVCNDDYSGWDPLVEIEDPPDGQYDVWVGSWSSSDFISGRLFITELDLGPDDYAGGGGDTGSLRVVNDSGTDIWYLYVSPTSSSVWGDDQLGANIIPDGESFTLGNIPFDTYDLRVEGSGNVEIETVFDVEIDGPVVWTVTGGDGSGWLPEIAQWASSATASSHWGSSDDYAPLQATGAPDTDECGDISTAWASSSSSGMDWLELTYLEPVIPTEINIYETHSPGCIVEVEVIDEDGLYTTVWDGGAEVGAQCPRIFSVPVLDVDFAVVGVRINLDQSTCSWDEIDAVELVGLEQ